MLDVERWALRARSRKLSELEVLTDHRSPIPLSIIAPRLDRASQTSSEKIPRVRLLRSAPLHRRSPRRERILWDIVTRCTSPYPRRVADRFPPQTQTSDTEYPSPRRQANTPGTSENI